MWPKSFSPGKHGIEELEERSQLFPLSAYSLLASGSDDQHTIVWDPLHHKKLLSMHTGHTANIFSVKVSRTSRRADERCGWALCVVVFACVSPTYLGGHRHLCDLSICW